MLLVEAAAQDSPAWSRKAIRSSALSGFETHRHSRRENIGRRPSGETLNLEARVTGRMENLIQADAQASSNGQLVMTAVLTLSGAKA